MSGLDLIPRVIPTIESPVCLVAPAPSGPGRRPGTLWPIATLPCVDPADVLSSGAAMDSPPSALSPGKSAIAPVSVLVTMPSAWLTNDGGGSAECHTGP